MNKQPLNISDELAKLEWEIKPQRDLWPNIAAELEPQVKTQEKYQDHRTAHDNNVTPFMRSNQPTALSPKQKLRVLLAIAASAVVAVATTLLITFNKPTPDYQQQHQAALIEFQQSYIALIEQQHQLIRDQLSSLVNDSSNSFDPHVVSEISTLIGHIDSAAAEIKSAMLAQPYDPQYTSMLVNTYQREMALLNRVKPKLTI